LGCAALLFSAALLLTACPEPELPAAKPPAGAAALSKAVIAKITPDRLTVTFKAAVNVENDEGTGLPDVSGFALTGSTNATRAVSLISGNGKSVLVLQLDGTASGGETIKLSYDGERITTKSNEKRVESFQDFPVTTTGVPDTIPPALVSATIADGAHDKLVLVFSEALKQPSPASFGSMLGFTVTGSGGLGLADAAYTLQDNTLTLTLNQNAVDRQSVSLSYSGTAVKDMADNELAPITNFDVENQIPQTWTVQFDWNGAGWDGATGGSLLTSMNPSQTTPITLPEAGNRGMTKNGYTHTGWTDDYGATTKPKGSSYTPTEDITLQAVWTPITYDIHYYFVVLNNDFNPPTYTIDDTTFPLESPPPDSGMSFVSWHSDSARTPGNLVTAIPQGSWGEKHFYAKWTLPNQNQDNDDNNLLSLTAMYPDDETPLAEVAIPPTNPININFQSANNNYDISVAESQSAVWLIARAASAKAAIKIGADGSTGAAGADARIAVASPEVDATTVTF
jgi:uncharacterized repeat protein (TIGR02543 family)